MPPRAPLLHLDPDLAQDMPPEESAAARAHVTAHVVELPAGAWEPPWMSPRAARQARPPVSGLLVLDGAIFREVSFAAASRARGTCVGAELLGPGDLLRPWQAGADGEALPHDSSWRVWEPSRAAVIDRTTMAEAGRWPSLVDALIGRVLRRSRWLSLAAAVNATCTARERVLLHFQYLSDRWGRVTPEGIVIELPLTHEALGQLLSLRRPTVTIAISWLADHGLLERRSRRSWMLDPDGVARFRALSAEEHRAAAKARAERPPPA